MPGCTSGCRAGRDRFPGAWTSPPAGRRRSRCRCTGAPAVRTAAGYAAPCGATGSRRSGTTSGTTSRPAGSRGRPTAAPKPCQPWRSGARCSPIPAARRSPRCCRPAPRTRGAPRRRAGHARGSRGYWVDNSNEPATPAAAAGDNPRGRTGQPRRVAPRRAARLGTSPVPPRAALRLIDLSGLTTARGAPIGGVRGTAAHPHRPRSAVIARSARRRRDRK